MLEDKSIKIENESMSYREFTLLIFGFLLKKEFDRFGYRSLEAGDRHKFYNLVSERITTLKNDNKPSLRVTAALALLEELEYLDSKNLMGEKIRGLEKVFEPTEKIGCISYSTGKHSLSFTHTIGIKDKDGKNIKKDVTLRSFTDLLSVTLNNYDVQKHLLVDWVQKMVGQAIGSQLKNLNLDESSIPLPLNFIHRLLLNPQLKKKHLCPNGTQKEYISKLHPLVSEMAEASGIIYFGINSVLKGVPRHFTQTVGLIINYDTKEFL